MKLKHLIPLIVLSLILGLTACNKGEEKLSAQSTDTLNVTVTDQGYIKFTKAQAEVAGIKTDTLSQKELSKVIICSGSVESSPGNKVSISVPMEAYIKQIFVKHGEKVKQGQPLVSVENLEFIDLQTDYLKKKAELEYIKDEYERQKKLYEQNAIPLKTYQQIKSQYDQLMADFKGLEQKLRILGLNPDNITPDNISSVTVVRSPINGIVGEIYVNLGQYVMPEDKIMDITNPTGYLIMLSVYGKYHSIIQPGQKVEFTVTGSSLPLHATIFSVSPVLDPQTKTFYAHAEPDANYKQLTEGAFVSAKIYANTEKVYAVPKLSLVKIGDRHFVYVEVEPYTYKRVEVQTGLETDNYVEIINYKDLLGKKIVISGANYIKAKEEFLNEE